MKIASPMTMFLLLLSLSNHRILLRSEKGVKHLTSFVCHGRLVRDREVAIDGRRRSLRIRDFPNKKGDLGKSPSFLPFPQTPD